MRRAQLGLLFVILSTVAIGAAGCGAISFDISQDIPATFVMGDPTAPPLVGDSTAPLSLDIQAETNQRHTGPASAAYLKDLSFTITIPQNGTFYFAQSVVIQLKPTNPNSTLQPVPIAELSPIPTDQNTIHVKPIPGVNMLPYSQQGAVIDAVVFATWPREDTTYVGHVVVTVKI
jgi:hypothetical protein